MIEKFWISKWQKNDYPLNPNEYISVIISKNNPGNSEAFEVITTESLKNTSYITGCIPSNVEVPLTGTRISLEYAEIEERKKQIEQLAKLPDQLNRLAQMLINTTQMIDRLNDRLMKLEINNR